MFEFNLMISLSICLYSFECREQDHAITAPAVYRRNNDFRLGTLDDSVFQDLGITVLQDGVLKLPFYYDTFFNQ